MKPAIVFFLVNRLRLLLRGLQCLDPGAEFKEAGGFIADNPLNGSASYLNGIFNVLPSLGRCSVISHW